MLQLCKRHAIWICTTMCCANGSDNSPQTCTGALTDRSNLDNFNGGVRERPVPFGRGTFERLPQLHNHCSLLFRSLPDILQVNAREILMSNSQRRVIQNYRSRLSEKGLARFEVFGRDSDLIHSLARRLAENNTDACRLRVMIGQVVAGEPPKKGGILAALRRSPLVGADLKVARPREEGHKVNL